MKQLVDVFERLNGPVLAVERVPQEDISNYGVIAIDEDASARLGPGVYQGARSRGEAEPRGRALEPRDHRPLRAHAGHLPGARRHQERSDGRNPADERAARAAEEAADLRVRSAGRAARHRQQARVPEGGRVLRAQAARPRRSIRHLPRERSTCRRRPANGNPATHVFVVPASPIRSTSTAEVRRPLERRSRRRARLLAPTTELCRRSNCCRLEPAVAFRDFLPSVPPFDSPRARRTSRSR